MKYKYVINCCETSINEKSYIRYGISCIDGNSIIEEVLDISENKKEVQNLVDKCNKLNLNPLEIKTIAKDFID